VKYKILSRVFLNGVWMENLDWIVIFAYLLCMFSIALITGRRQKSSSDYFLAGRSFSSGSLAASTLATQCSTNSLLGAPAFVGFSLGGGLIWLQYELAVPIAMLILLYILGPARRLGVTSIYEVVDRNIGRRSRLTAAGCFLFFRSVATGVTVYGSSLILSFLLGIDLFMAVFLIMGLTIFYDLLGGLAAIVASDILQLFLLTTAIIFALAILGDAIDWDFFLTDRGETLSNDWGFAGNDYGFWPMLFGGIFLYAAYYGCDQSQSQRILASRSEEETKQILMFNGIFRFPLVLLYCFLGLGLASLAQIDREFILSLPLLVDGTPNYNLVFPVFVMNYFSPGFVGLVLVGLIAAAMSSIDSSINSLAAVTVEDFIKPNLNPSVTPETLLKYGRVCTFLWGCASVVFSFQVPFIAPTVLEAVNKIGSMINGPLLALICIATLVGEVDEISALLGFWIGALSNLALALFLPQVSWLWWNVSGFLTAVLVFLVISQARSMVVTFRVIGDAAKKTPTKRMYKNIFNQVYHFSLLIMFVIILLVCYCLNNY
tara:strand:+ start:21 stop:1655 length:1635 start_codon:yes stop_codon:yes gene_type:complete